MCLTAFCEPEGRIWGGGRGWQLKLYCSCFQDTWISTPAVQSHFQHALVRTAVELCPECVSI